MASAEPNQYECPVCHEDYIDPKILRCAHLVCRKCIVTWLRKEGNQAGCPLCRAPILPVSDKGQGDLGSAVDALPTDLVTAAVVASQHILNSRNSCVCDDSTEAKFLCLQCRIKLCNSCAKSHLKSPVIQHHIVEDLNDITAEKLAGFHQSFCSSHGNKTAELYCRSHQELICVLCAASGHRQCLDVGGIGEEANIQRAELKKQVERFREKERVVVEKIKEIDRQIADGKTKFQLMRAELKSTFSDLKDTVEAQYQKLTRDLDQREEAYIAETKTPRADLDMHRVRLDAHTNIMEKVASVSDDFLLGMLSKLNSHLDDLESEKPKDEANMEVTELESINLGTELVATLKKLICMLGQVSGQNAPCSLCGQKLILDGPAYAAVMKEGDRVRRGRDWDWGNQDGNPPGLGTITSLDPNTYEKGWVGVKWDQGKRDNYRMGKSNKYDLQFDQYSQSS